VKIYHYHPITKELLCEGKADLSPLDLKFGREVYMIPANATNTEPPQRIENKAIIFDGEWKYRDVEVVAEKDVDNTSPSTESAFTKVARLLESVNAELVEVKSKLLEKEERISNLEKKNEEIKPDNTIESGV
jgi:hypothetical protein